MDASPASPATPASDGLRTPFTRSLGIEVPIICGAMYPCSNPELVAAVSRAGGIGVVQPVSMVYVHRHDFRAGLKLIRQTTDRPFGVNIIVEKSAKAYEDRMRAWLDAALEEGARLVVTALGNPRWVVLRAHGAGAIVYHDVTDRRWAMKALEAGVDGLIAVNARAGGHAGTREPAALFEELRDLGVPVICAGGVGDEERFREALALGYAGVQMGTRFIATPECHVHPDYKRAIIEASAADIVLTEKLSGVPCAVIRTPYVDRVGTRAGPIARWLLRGHRTKHWVRAFYSLLSLRTLKRASQEGRAYQDYFQAGKSVEGIERVEPAGEIVRRFAAHVRERAAAPLDRGGPPR